MDTVEAVFQIPDWIANGLNNGNYERVGGIIREVDSKSVVAWLRETDFTQVSPGQVISSASRLLKFGDVVGVLNLGVSVTGFTVILNRIKHLETSISEQNALLTQIDRKLDLSYYRNFATGIRLANDAMMTQNPNTKRITAMQAVDRILDAQHLFEQECNSQIAAGNEIADKLISTLFLAYTAEIRCRMELGEMALATSKLEQYSETMRTLVRTYLKKSYLSFDTNHLWCIEDLSQCTDLVARIWRLEDFLEEDVERLEMSSAKAADSDVYKKQQADLEKSENNIIKAKENLVQAQNKKGLLATVQAAGIEFQLGVLDEMYASTKNRIEKFTAEKQQYYAQDLPALLAQMESVIEDMRRFEAYQDEVAALQQMGISLDEWQQIRPKNVPKGQAANTFLLIPQTVP